MNAQEFFFKKKNVFLGTRLVTVCAQSLNLLYLLHTKQTYWHTVILPEWRRYYSWIEGGSHFVSPENSPSCWREWHFTEMTRVQPQTDNLLSQRKIYQSGKQAYCQRFRSGVWCLLLWFGVCSLYTCAGLSCGHLSCVLCHYTHSSGMVSLVWFTWCLLASSSSCWRLGVFCVLTSVDSCQHPPVFPLFSRTLHVFLCWIVLDWYPGLDPSSLFLIKMNHCAEPALSPTSAFCSKRFPRLSFAPDKHIAEHLERRRLSLSLDSHYDFHHLTTRRVRVFLNQLL